MQNKINLEKILTGKKENKKLSRVGKKLFEILTIINEETNIQNGINIKGLTETLNISRITVQNYKKALLEKEKIYSIPGIVDCRTTQYLITKKGKDYLNYLQQFIQ